MSNGTTVGRYGILAGQFEGFELEALRGFAATFALFSPGQFVIVDARHPNDAYIPGLAPYVQVLNMTPDEFVMEVPGNRILAPPFALTDRQEDLLGHLGFAPPHPDDEFPNGDEMWRYLFEFVEVPGAAAVMVTTLSDVFALPVLLAASVSDAGNVGDGPGPCLHAVGWHGSG